MRGCVESTAAKKNSDLKVEILIVRLRYIMLYIEAEASFNSTGDENTLIVG